MGKLDFVRNGETGKIALSWCTLLIILIIFVISYTVSKFPFLKIPGDILSSICSIGYFCLLVIYVYEKIKKPKKV